MRDPQQGDIYQDKILKNEHTISHKSGNLIYLEKNDVPFVLNDFQEGGRFKFIYGHTEITLINYLCSSLRKKPEMYQELLKISREESKYNNSILLKKTYDDIEEAFGFCFQPNFPNKSLSAISGWLKKCDNKLSLMAARILEI